MQISRHWRMNPQRYRLEGLRYPNGRVSLQPRPVLPSSMVEDSYCMELPDGEAYPSHLLSEIFVIASKLGVMDDVLKKLIRISDYECLVEGKNSKERL